jgi:hypothetical protein
MTVTKEHKHNGKLLGHWHESEELGQMYIAVRSRRHIHRERNAWLFDSSLLSKCRDNGVGHIGVQVRVGGKKLLWLTPVDDLFNSPDSFPHSKETRQRGLPLNRFQIDPLKDAANIEASFHLR